MQRWCFTPSQMIQLYHSHQFITQCGVFELLSTFETGGHVKKETWQKNRGFWGNELRSRSFRNVWNTKGWKVSLKRLEGGNLMVILLMVRSKSGVHQLRLVLYPMIYSVSYIPGDARFKPSTVLLMVRSKSGGYRLHPRSLTASLPLKNGGTGRWSIPIGKVTFQGRAVKLREGNR